MQPNSNWQPGQDSGSNNNQSVGGQNQQQPVNQPQQPADSYQGQTLQQIDDSVRSQDSQSMGVQDNRPVPNVTINSLASNSNSAPSEGLPNQEVHWEAKEYITPDKNTAWYVGLGVVVVLVILLDIFFLRAYTVSVLIIVIAIVLVVMTIRPARTIQYRMNNEGISIDEQFMKFSDYKSFGLYKEHDSHSILLIPVKRFLPGLSIYFPEDQGESIVNLLAQKLPNQEVKQDFMDKIVRMLRL